MNTMKQNREEVLVSLFEKAAGTDAWGTEFGASVFAQINLGLLSLGEGTLVLLDYAGLERSDVSFQREAVVETLRKHRPRLLFIALNLSDVDLRENLQLALERRGEWLLARDPDGTAVIGKRLTPEQQATLERIWQDGDVTSSDFEIDQVKLSTASSRLSYLWKAGLAERIEGTSPTGGREHRYVAVT